MLSAVVSQLDDGVRTGSGSDRVTSWQTIFSLGCDPVATAPGTDSIFKIAGRAPSIQIARPINQFDRDKEGFGICRIAEKPRFFNKST